METSMQKSCQTFLKVRRQYITQTYKKRHKVIEKERTKSTETETVAMYNS